MAAEFYRLVIGDSFGGRGARVGLYVPRALARGTGACIGILE